MANTIRDHKGVDVGEPRSEIQEFVEAVEEFKRALLKACEPVILPILRWLTWRLAPGNSNNDMLSWREWWAARKELAATIKGYAVSQIEEREELSGLRWHVTFDGNHKCSILIRTGPEYETEMVTITDVCCLKDTPWGTLGYGYNEERAMGVIFVAPEQAVDNQYAKNVSASSA